MRILNWQHGIYTQGFCFTVSDGQPADQATFNAAFASKTADNTLAGEQTINNDVNINGDLTVTGTQTTIDTTNLDVTDKNITVNDGGNDASSEGAGITVERTGTDGSIVYEDALATKFKVGAVASEVEVVDVSTAQTLTNKTIDANNNPITNLAHGAEVDNPSSGVHGVAGDVVGATDAQVLTNKTIDADLNTISNLAHGAEVDEPSAGVHGVSGSIVGTTDTQALTNKDIDGVTAADTSRITLPKETTVNLDALTDKEGTMWYDTTLVKPVFNDGTDNIELASVADVAGGNANSSDLIENHSLAAAASVGALTVDLETQAAATPSAGSPVRISHLNATLATGTYDIRSAVVDTDVVIPSTATLGFVDGDDARVHVYSIDNAGTIELAVAGSRTFDESELHTTVAITTGSDLGTTLYSTTLRSNVTIRYLGFIQIDAITTAGTWTAPDEIRLHQGQQSAEERLEAELTATTTTVTADTEIDVTGASLPLRAGTWDIGYDFLAVVNELSAAQNTVIGRLRITDSADVYLDQSDKAFGGVLEASVTIFPPVSHKLQITITETTTFKVRITCNETNTAGSVTAQNQTLTGGITGDDTASIFWARRVPQ